MGYYINPSNGTKEEWLKANAQPISTKEICDLLVKPTRQGSDLLRELPICLVQNPAFSAAAVIFNEKELMAFSQPTDDRPKLFFKTTIQKLVPVVSNIEDMFTRM